MRTSRASVPTSVLPGVTTRGIARAVTNHPPPLRTDASNAFAYRTMRVRAPRIARDVVDRERPPARVAEAVERLARDLEEDRRLPRARPPAPDLDGWALDDAAHAGDTWQKTEWFFAEHLFYRELAHAYRFWETGRDPFDGVKEQELGDDRPWRRLGGATAKVGPRDERVLHLLDESLWGNRVDLSYLVAADREQREADDLLVDDRQRALPSLLRPGAHVHVVVDNVGTELVLDLALVGALLEDTTARVTVHLKMHPVFVSDATAPDVWRVFRRMRDRGGEPRALADRLASAFDDERLRLAPDPFWSGPRFLWQAPAHVADALAGATAVVFKGDANYRRVVGDALWPAETPLAVAAPFLRSPTLCLRTMKSDPVVGLPAGVAERLDASDPTWRIDGRRGVAQAVVPGLPTG